MTEIKIVVQDGMVTDVYSTEKEILVEVLDLDTQDPDEFEEMEAEQAKILRDFHTWHAVY